MTTNGQHVVMLGLMGAGKTSIGTRVAERLGWPMVDSDVRLEASTGRTAAEIADENGLDALHVIEEEIALAALAEMESTVIAAAASVCESARVRDALADHVVVWLSAPIDLLASRADEKSHRPLVERSDIAAVLERQRAIREPLVRPLAELVIDVATVTIDEAADEIVELVTARDDARRSASRPRDR